MQNTAILNATGLWTPPYSISNAELVESFNTWADQWNAGHAGEISSGAAEPKAHSSTAFIEKASGVKARYVLSKEPILDPEIMTPHIPERPDGDISVLAEMAIAAATNALEAAGRDAADVDVVLVACSNLQRPYPAIAIEVQDALGMKDGYAYDMNMGCSSATFGLATARSMIMAGQARSVLVCSPEIVSGHINFRNRDSHFIFGDAATAILVEEEGRANGAGYDIVSTKLKTKFSNNIRNNFGFLNRAAPEGIDADDKLFVQQGRKVFRDVVPLVSAMITEHLAELDLTPHQLKRLWLHQANLSMNRLIAKRVMGQDVGADEAPVILDEYANTASAGSIIAFHKHNEDLHSGDLGLICSFGAGYSAGTVVLRKR